MNYSNMTIEEIALDLVETSINKDITLEQASYNLLTEKHNYLDLEIIEEYAIDNGFAVTCEQDLSDKFDEDVNEYCDKDSLIKYENGLDLPMLHEHFNDWADSLAQQGEIHQEQADSYSYIGAFEYE